MSKLVMIEIDANGDPSVETAGYKGKGCEAVQKAFGDALGTTVKAVKKPEFFQTVVNKKQVIR